MSIPNVSVERYSITIDTNETLQVVQDNASSPWGRRLYDALNAATQWRTSAFVASPYCHIDLDDFRPDRPALTEVTDMHVSGVLSALQKAEYLDMRTVWRETSSETYLSDGRILIGVEVHKPFVVLNIDYQLSSQARTHLVRYGTAYADYWAIAERSYIVPAGGYLLCETGDFSADLICVAGLDADLHDSIFEWEGFGAFHCFAGCGSCGLRWLTESGSWHFCADDCDAASWYFDDAKGFDDSNTIACPACTTGRVGFAIF